MRRALMLALAAAATLAAAAAAAAAAADPPLWGPLSPGAATARSATQLLEALESGVGDITLAGNVTLTPEALAQFQLPIVIEPNATVLVHAPAGTSQRMLLDWGSAAGVLEVLAGATLAFDRVISHHPAPYGSGRPQLPVEVKGSFLWPTVSGPAGHTVVFNDSYIYTDITSCSPEVVKNELERLRQMLGHEVGTYLGGTAAFLPYIPSPVPIQSNIDYQQLGNAMYTVVNSTLECYDSTLASRSSGSSSNTVAIVVGSVIGGLALCAIAVGGYAWRRKRRRRVTVDAEKGGGQDPPCSPDVLCCKADEAGDSLELRDSASGLGQPDASAGSVAPPPPASHASSGGNPSPESTGRPANGSHGSVDVHYSALMRSRWSGALDGVVLGELLGRGSFGRVFKGRWQGAVVAVKVIEYEVHAGSTCDLSREPLLSLTLSHPNVVATHKVCILRLNSGAQPQQAAPQECGRLSDNPRAGAPATLAHGSTPLSRSRSTSLDTDGMAGAELVPLNEPLLPGLYESWLVQDFCDSGSLADLVSASSRSQGSAAGSGSAPSTGGKDRLGRLRASICCSPDPEQAMLANLLCLLDVASGLDYLHTCCNMVHGDLKPANCLLRSVPAYTDRRGVTVKLADFGLSRLLNPDETSIHTGSTGTPGFAAPELLTDGKLTKAADIYSLGIIMWSLVARASPHPGSNPLSIIYLVAHQRFRPPIPDGCPPGLAALMQRCWAHDAAQRPTAAEVVRELRALLRSHARDLAAAALPPAPAAAP